jgi:hypothetical protein
VGGPVGVGNSSKSQLDSRDLVVSAVERLARRPNGPRLMKPVLGREISEAVSSSSSSFGFVGGSLEGNSVGRNTAGTYKGFL